MPRKKAVSWVVVGGDGALCQRCGKSETLPLPMTVDAFVKWGEYFMEKHRYCIEKQEEQCPKNATP